MQVLKVLKEVATPLALLFLVGLALYNNVLPRSERIPMPNRRPSDQAVVKMGKEYGLALVKAAADTLEASAARPWKSTSQAAQQNQEDFGERASRAWKPVATELTHRFGPTSDQPVDSAQASEVRQFCRDLATGIRAEAKR